jgi:drug/metabolite transporter (DMT)-like permease
MGIGSYLYASSFAKFGFLGNGFLGPGMLIVTTLTKILFEFRYRLKNKRWFREENSAWIAKDTGKVYFINLIPWLGGFLCNTVYIVSMTFAWRFSQIGGLNQGIISNLLSFSSVINLFTFKLFFKQSVSIAQIIGIFLMIIGLACISIKLES